MGRGRDLEISVAPLSLFFSLSCTTPARSTRTSHLRLRTRLEPLRPLHLAGTDFAASSTTNSASAASRTMVKLFERVEDRPTPKAVYNWRVYSCAIVAATAAIMIGSVISSSSSTPSPRLDSSEISRSILQAAH